DIAKAALVGEVEQTARAFGGDRIAVSGKSETAHPLYRQPVGHHSIVELDDGRGERRRLELLTQPLASVPEACVLIAVFPCGSVEDIGAGHDESPPRERRDDPPLRGSPQRDDATERC